MNKPQLNIFYELEDFCKTEFNKILRYNVLPLHLPTEVVISQPSIICPVQARAWRTDFYCHDGKILTSGELARIPGFNGVSNYDNVILAEIWDDQGSDGHTHYTHTGYMFTAGLYLEDGKYPERALLERLTMSFISKKRDG